MYFLLYHFEQPPSQEKLSSKANKKQKSAKTQKRNPINPGTLLIN